MVTQSDIARHAGLDISTVNRILNNRSTATFRERTIKRVLNVARELGFNLNRLRYFHRRQASRVPASINCELQVHTCDGMVYDQGKCRISNLSEFGALILEVVLGRESIPTGLVKITLRPQEGPLQGLELSARIVRYQSRSVSGYGVEFGKLKRKNYQKLCRFISQIAKSKDPGNQHE